MSLLLGYNIKTSLLYFSNWLILNMHNIEISLMFTTRRWKIQAVSATRKINNHVLIYVHIKKLTTSNILSIMER